MWLGRKSRELPYIVLECVREAIGEEMLIALRFSVNEFVDDGITMEEVAKTAQLLQDKIDILQCSVGIRSGMHSLCITHPIYFLKEDCNSYAAQEMKKYVDIPIDAIGAINDPDVAEKLLAEGTCDFVAMARAQIADLRME